MYGIFKATAELKERPEAAWSIVEADTERHKLIKKFKTLEEAKETLKDYSARIDKNSYVTTVYNCEVYYVADILLDDEDEGYTEYNIIDGDGYAITPLG